jgi:hypothetical protein
MHNEHPKGPSQGLLRPGRVLWARALPWSFVDSALDCLQIRPRSWALLWGWAARACRRA